MKMKRWIRKIVPMVGAVMFVLFTGITAYADVDTGSLTVDVSYDNTGISGAEFEIYKVQQWENPESDHDPEWCGAFAGFGGEEIDGKKIGSLRGCTAKFVKSVAELLETHIRENDGISADMAGSTGKNGRAVFSSLDPGVYLVIVTQQPKGYIVTSPFLVTVPKIDSKGDVNVTVKAKIEALPTPTPTSTPKPTPMATPTSTATPAPTSTPTPAPSATPGPTSPPTPGPTDPPPVRTPGPTNPPPAPTSPATPAPSTTPAPPEPTEPPATPTDPPRITNRPNPTPTPDQAVLGMRRRRGWEKGVLGRRRLPQTGTLQWPIPTLAGAGILLFFTGWIRRYGKKNKPEDGNGSSSSRRSSGRSIRRFGGS